MATCEWCGGTGWGEARPKVGLARKWLRVPCPNPECVYRAEDSPTAASGAENDPRVEAAARAILDNGPWTPKWDRALDDIKEMCRTDAQSALAAADAVDPLRDRGRCVSTIEQAVNEEMRTAAHVEEPERGFTGRSIALAVFDAVNGEQG